MQRHITRSRMWSHGSSVWGRSILYKCLFYTKVMNYNRNYKVFSVLPLPYISSSRVLKERGDEPYLIGYDCTALYTHIHTVHVYFCKLFVSMAELGLHLRCRPICHTKLLIWRSYGGRMEVIWRLRNQPALK